MEVKVDDVCDLRPITLALKKERSSGSLEILKHVLIRARENGTVEFISTDLDHTKIYRIEADVTESGSVCVNLMEFHRVVNKLRKFGGPLEIRDEDDNEAFSSFHHERLDFRMHGSHPDDFPEVDVKREGTKHCFDPDRFRSALDSTSIAMSSDETRSNLCGVYIEGGFMISTDGHRLRKVVLEDVQDTTIVEQLDEGSRESDGVDFDGTIVPACAINALEYGLGKFKSERVVVHESDEQVTFDFGDHTITANPIEGTFPDFALVIPDFSDATTITTDRKETIKSLEAVQIFTSEGANAARLSTEGREGDTELYASDPGKGEGYSELKGTSDGPPVKAFFNADFLKDALKDVGGDTIEISIFDELSPTRIRDTEDDLESFWIVMPKRL